MINEKTAKAIMNQGFYDKNGSWNSVIKFPLDPNIYRGRVETIIVRDKKEVFVKRRPNGEYFLPGGSWEKTLPNIEQAINECKEEARINVRNIEFTGITYKKLTKDRPSIEWMKSLTKNDGDDINNKVLWDGSYNEVYIAEYDSLYKGEISKEDQDAFILSGHFYPVKQCLKFFNEEHCQALIWFLKERILPDEIVAESVYENNLNNFLYNNIKTPEDLSKWMKSNIKYSEYKRLMSAEDVYKQKKGSCHDQVVLELYAMKKMHIKHGSLFMMECDDKGNGGQTHSLVWYTIKKKYYWFENAWQDNAGIHGPYSTLTDLKNEVRSKWEKNSMYPNFFFTSVKNVRQGMDLSQFVRACTNEEKPMTESTSNNDIYYISTNKINSCTLLPRIPNNFLTQNGFADRKTARIAFHKTIDGAVMNIDKKEPGKEFFVYIPDIECSYHNPTKNEQPESDITDEVWVTEKIPIRCIGKIKIGEEKENKGHEYTYGKKTAKIYEWNWSWIEKYDNKLQNKYFNDVNNDKAIGKMFKSHINKLANDEYYNKKKTNYNESALSTKERNEIPDNIFGIPELRKYPLNDREHVKLAIRYFNYVDVEYEEELARNIFKAMKKYGISYDIIGDKNRLKRYVKERNQ